MASRLDRLFVLLESGSSTVTRRAAAQQLGEVQKLRPRELHRLLARIYIYLKSPAWETRIAAGQAIEAILKNVPHWDPSPDENKNDGNDDYCDESRLRFKTFDLEKVLTHGAHLMGSEGKEYDIEEDSNPITDIREKLARQRQQLNTRLGLDVVSKLGMDMSDLFTNDDLIDSEKSSSSSLNTSNVTKQQISEIFPKESQLSSREKNRAKRKARQQKNLTTEDLITKREEPDKKKFKGPENNKPDEILSIYGDWLPDVDGSWSSEVQWWPLEGWANALATDLFNVQWEIRHGAATALRDMLKSHGNGVGKEVNLSFEKMEEMHLSWLEDMALRLFCVLALDRFGDFVSDQVVAPVRETCAQCLGVIASLIGPSGTIEITKFLTVLTHQHNWEARHGALLGFKYLLAVQQELGQSSLSFLTVIKSLWDPVDDVAAAAASALAPVSKTLIRQVPKLIQPTVVRLQKLLHTQDEFAAACGCFMTLLAALLSEPEIDDLLGAKYMSRVIPRLWPYISHPSSSVRRAALQTLKTITHCKEAIFVIESIKKEPEIKSITEIPHDSKDDMLKCGSETDDILNQIGCINENEIEDDVEWNFQLLQDTLRHIFQRVLVEHIQDIKSIAEEVWNNLIKCSSLEYLLNAACPYVSTWICFVMQPANVPFNPAHLIQSKLAQKAKNQTANDTSEIMNDLTDPSVINAINSQKWYLGGGENASQTIREANVTKTRCITSQMLGLLSCYIVKPAPGVVYTPEIGSPIDCYVNILLVHISSKSALQQLVCGLIICSWAKNDPCIKPGPPVLVNKLHQCLNQSLYYDEVAMSCQRILQDTRDFIAMMRHYKVPVGGEEFLNIISLDQVCNITGDLCNSLISKSKLKPKIAQQLVDRRKSILSAATQCINEQNSLNISTLAALAGACANLNALPEKLNPVIKPLMEAIKKEDNEHLQQLAAGNLALLLKQCVDRQPSPNPKVLVNLCVYLKSDQDFTPKIIHSGESTSNGDSESGESSVECVRNSQTIPPNDSKNGIITLFMQQKQAERMIYKRSYSTNNSNHPGQRGPGRPPNTEIPLEELFPQEDEVHKNNRIQRRGAAFALTNITTYFGDELQEKLPKLWEILTSPLNYSSPKNSTTVNEAEDLVSNLQVLEIVIPSVSKKFLPFILSKLKCLVFLLENEFKAVRHMASRCIAALAQGSAPDVMQIVVENVLPLLGVVDCDKKRQGASEALAAIIEKLQINIVPYIVLLVVPLLGRMSDHNEPVRLMSTYCFATLIQLMPLDGAILEPVKLSEELETQRTKDRLFLEQLFHPKSIGNYKIPIPVNAELRSYQQAGINWLWFLNKYMLHGILCDDMGLGKTLQSICMVASDHHERAQKYMKDKSPDCAPLPSLVVCPPTLTGHWVYEVKKFLSSEYLNPLHYVGPPMERDKLKAKIKNHNLVVASYDIVRKDIDFFGNVNWNYCILDEGHVIKNGKTKASKAIKTIVANHRLILSGTPIQNNVLELWSLFDFLMPGLLGTEKQFTARYCKPILAARDSRATAQHQETGALAMEALHRQVLPFLLRRMKEDVLQELPPKITQDYYCDLSPLQKRLYEDFSKVHMPNGIQSGDSKQHIFQALRYLQNVCNHPKLVLTPQHPEFSKISQELSHENSNLDEIQHSAKLPALKQLLLDCGIGSQALDTSTPILSQHRALIFCQLKTMLDVVEKDLLKPLLPQVSYLRLDGSVPPGQRHQVVERFNNDPSIDILLLTTQAGGLGLNLTGADTVIFVEHDWNPMKDLQAMDRAHRIGQKKVVNVYRLITRGTVEEKIMGLQKFKLLTANTVIGTENVSLETMGTDRLLDLFNLNDDKNYKFASFTSEGSTSGVSVKSIIEELPDLWDDQQYESEYDMTNFVQSLSKK